MEHRKTGLQTIDSLEYIAIKQEFPLSISWTGVESNFKQLNEMQLKV